MSVRLKNSCAARNQEMRLANAAVGEMIHACDVQVHELRNMPLDGGFQSFVGQHLGHGGRVGRPRTVVEGRNDFLVAQAYLIYLQHDRGSD